MGGPIPVPLTQGYVALVDAEDAVRVLSYRWQTARAQSGLVYASASQRHIRRQYRMLHRFVLGITDRGITVDHINGDGLDCRRENLRLATQQQQTWNRRIIDRPKSSRFKGVFWRRDHRLRAGGDWCARLTVNGKRLYAYRRSEIVAALAYNDMARQHFGEFAWLNTIEGGE